MKISVITVVLNADADFALTAESILGQTYANTEWVVVDGSSWSQRGRDMLVRYQEHMDVFASKPDGGVYEAMNAATQLATGDAVLFLNSGDIFYREDTLATISEEMNDGSDIVFGDHDYVSEGVHHFRRASDFSRMVEYLKAGQVNGRWHDHFPCHQATVYRREVFDRLQFDDRLKIVADHELLLRANAAGMDIRHIDIVISRYYAGGFSSKFVDRCQAEWASVYSLYSDHPKSVIRRFLGEQVSSKLSASTTSLLIGGHDDWELENLGFSGETSARVRTSGLRILSTAQQAVGEFGLHGFAHSDQVLAVSVNGAQRYEAIVPEGMFRIAPTLPAGFEPGDMIVITSEPTEVTDNTNLQEARWSYFAHGIGIDARPIKEKLSLENRIEIEVGQTTSDYSDAIVRLPRTWFASKRFSEASVRVQVFKGQCQLEIRPDTQPQVAIPERFYITEDKWGRVFRMTLKEGLSKEPQKYCAMAESYSDSRQLDFATVVVNVIEKWPDIRDAFEDQAEAIYEKLPVL